MKKLLTHGRYILCYCLLFLFLPVFCFAQRRDDVGITSLSGYIYDKNTQKILTGASVTITNTNTSKTVATTTSGSEGSYFFDMQPLDDIRIAVTMEGYKKSEKRFTKKDLTSYKNRIPPIYLDTTIKFNITPAAPVRQSTEEYVKHQFELIDMVPVPAAYDLLVYLNPDLRGRDSLMSNDKIVLPKMPRISNSVKRDNKKQFQTDKGENRDMQNRLSDSIDKISRILGDDISRYKIQYEDGNAGMLKQIREYMRMDLQDYRGRISKTSKLKAEGIIELLAKMSEIQEKIVAEKRLTAGSFIQMKAVWEDLSYLLQTNRYNLFVKNGEDDKNKTVTWFMTTSLFCSAMITGIVPAEMPGTAKTGSDLSEMETPYYEDEVGVFGFVVWSPDITSKTKPDLSEPESRYVIRYFKPAFADDKNAYKICSRNANVAIANLNRAKYGVEVYDTREKKYVETLYPFFSTDEAFTDKGYDALLVPDFKEIKYIPIRLK